MAEPTTMFEATCPDCFGDKYTEDEGPDGAVVKTDCPRCEGEGSIGHSNWYVEFDVVKHYTLQASADSEEEIREMVEEIAKSGEFPSGAQMLDESARQRLVLLPPLWSEGFGENEEGPVWMLEAPSKDGKAPGVSTGYLREVAAKVIAEADRLDAERSAT